MYFCATSTKLDFRITQNGKEKFIIKCQKYADVILDALIRSEMQLHILNDELWQNVLTQHEMM